MTRTVSRYTRVYQNGYDLSGEATQIGDLNWEYAYDEVGAFAWAVRGGLMDQATITTGTVNTIMRVEAEGFSPHTTLTGWKGANVRLMLAMGLGTAPVMGVPAWCAVQQQKRVYAGVPASGLVTCSLDYSPALLSGTTELTYDIPWGVILHPLGAETAASTAAGYDAGAAAVTDAGGWMMVQVTAVEGEGTATISVQSATANSNANFADVTGLSVAVAHTAIPGAVVAQAAHNATVNRYVRAQVALDGITSVSYVLAFMRGR